VGLRREFGYFRKIVISYGFLGASLIIRAGFLCFSAVVASTGEKMSLTGDKLRSTGDKISATVDIFAATGDIIKNGYSDIKTS
jgi:hypothetical protein